VIIFLLFLLIKIPNLYFHKFFDKNVRGVAAKLKDKKPSDKPSEKPSENDKKQNNENPKEQKENQTSSNLVLENQISQQPANIPQLGINQPFEFRVTIL
jgi:hypothetical protein